MNGYRPERRIDLANRFKMVMHPADVFHKGKFDVIHVSTDIRIITGKRLSAANERRVRRLLGRK